MFKSETSIPETTAFKNALKPELEKLLPPHISVSISDYVKNNNNLRMGVNFIPDEFGSEENIMNISPIIYVDGLYQKYLQGELGIDDIAILVSEEYLKYLDYSLDPMNFPEDFESAKSRVVMKLMNTGTNREFLETVPHLDILDLSVTFFYMIETDTREVLSCTITHAIMEDWNVDVGTLLAAASANAPSLLPPSLFPLSHIVREPLRKTGDPDAVYPIPLDPHYTGLLSSIADSPGEADPEIYVLTNFMGAHGAAVILYKGLARAIADWLGDDFYILPCSVHELLLLRVNSGAELDKLREIVVSVNDSAVLPEEFLSDTVYRYSRSAGLIDYA